MAPSAPALGLRVPGPSGFAAVVRLRPDGGETRIPPRSGRGQDDRSSHRGGGALRLDAIDEAGCGAVGKKRTDANPQVVEAFAGVGVDPRRQLVHLEDLDGLAECCDPGRSHRVGRTLVASVMQRGPLSHLARVPLLAWQSRWRQTPLFLTRSRAPLRRRHLFSSVARPLRRQQKSRRCRLRAVL
jgi:hypothetical protein